MTTRTEAGAEKSFVSALLPWIVAASVTVIYLLTLNHWLSFKNLPVVARATGQTWTPQIYLPLFTLVTSPFHWLPETFVPLATNLFSMVCAFFVLLLLARSVTLLPHDRTQKQRDRIRGSSALLSSPAAWVPPLFAVLVCGLQLTFWENATTLSSGMFDLVLFAYSVRCLLEYRISQRESWILRAAVVYAAASSDTWVMVILFPAFLTAIIWIRGLGFFNLNFLARLFLCIMAGFLVYFYLPLLHWKSYGLFWPPFKENIAAQFSQITYICRYTPHHIQLLLLLTSLFPIFIIAIRWGKTFGDTSRTGILLTTWVFHLTHAALLLACVWAAFDTGFGLRDAAADSPILDANRERFLPLYYLAALSIGYLSGYFLIVFRPVTRRGRPVGNAQKGFHIVSLSVICILLVLAPTGLLYKNVPEIRNINGPALRNYAAMLTEHFPSEGIILSDNPASLWISEAWLARSGKAKNFVFFDTGSFKFASYYRFRARESRGLLPPLSTNILDTAVLTDFQALELMANLAEKHPVYYLEPSFGYYFEAFYPVPHGLTYELKRYPSSREISAPPLSEEVLTENETFWKQHDAEIRTLLPFITPPTDEADFTARQRFLKKLQIPLEKSFDAIQLGAIYARALNTWGVQAQRMGRLETAGAHFDEAALLFPDNVVAKANSDFNKKLRKGERVPVENPQTFEQRFGKFSSWEQLLTVNGMFDEPSGCLGQGIVFYEGNLAREAAQNLERSLVLAPESLLARLWLGRVYLLTRTPEKALKLADELRARASSAADAGVSPSEAFQLELAANYATTNDERATRLVSETLSQAQPDPALLDVAGRVCVYYKDFTNALRVVNRELTLDPSNPTKLVNAGFVNIQMGDFSAAIAPLSKALSLQPTNTTALFCRAVAYLQTDKLDESQRDYEALEKMKVKNLPIYHGLAEVAYRKKDTAAAIHYYELDLANTTPNSPEANFAAERLKKLKAGSP